MNEQTSGPHRLSQSILRNYQSALLLVRDAITGFDDSQWRRGELPLQVPWRLAYHVVECLDYYFRKGAGSDFQWGYRFGGGWWSLETERIPTQSDVLAYLGEVEERLLAHLSSLTDDRLVEPFEPGKEHGLTRLGHYLYGLRHTMHHHGEMSLLSLQFGNPEGAWQ